MFLDWKKHAAHVKQSFAKLGKDHPNPAALGAAELQAELARQNRLPNDLHRLLQDFIALNYANAQAPAKRAAQAWYRRAKRLAHKYRTER